MRIYLVLAIRIIRVIGGVWFVGILKNNTVISDVMRVRYDC